MHLNTVAINFPADFAYCASPLERHCLDSCFIFQMNARFINSYVTMHKQVKIATKMRVSNRWRLFFMHLKN